MLIIDLIGCLTCFWENIRNAKEKIAMRGEEEERKRRMKVKEEQRQKYDEEEEEEERKSGARGAEYTKEG